MKRNLTSITIAVVLAVTYVSCDKVKPPLPELQKPAVANAATAQDTQRRAFTQAAHKELDELARAIGELKQKAGTMNAQAQAKLNQEQAKLEAQKLEVEKLLADLESATLENWGGLKQTFGSALEKLKAGVAAIRKSAN